MWDKAVEKVRGKISLFIYLLRFRKLYSQGTELKGLLNIVGIYYLQYYTYAFLFFSCNVFSFIYFIISNIQPTLCCIHYMYVIYLREMYVFVYVLCLYYCSAGVMSYSVLFDELLRGHEMASVVLTSLLFRCK